MAEAGVQTQRTRTRDGTELEIRQVRPDDKRLIAEGMERLSPESRYRRFFRPLDRLSERDLVYLTEIDHTDHEALAAIDPESGDLVGVARYVRGAEPQMAEVSVAVGDPWQRHGVATALLERLVERARAAQITHFVALVMDDNVEAIRLFEHRGAGPCAPAPQRLGPSRAVDRAAGAGPPAGLDPGTSAACRRPWRRHGQPVPGPRATRSGDCGASSQTRRLPGPGRLSDL